MSSSSPNPPSQPPGIPAEGDLLAGKYRVEHVLGIGGMGVVVAARHIDLDERVAVKFLLPHVPPHGEPVARFLREARAAIKIRSDHVVRILDVARLENGAPYIVMEYLEGKDLARVLAEGPLSVADAVRHLLQACEAIAEAHAMGIVHRDLKPANLFLTTASDGSPRVKVLDFGISKLTSGNPSDASGLTSTSTIMGTPCFMSPEQLRSTRDVDGRADIWSLGAILYALLTGSPPYDGESNADVSAKIIRDAPPALRDVRGDVPVEVEAIVRRCLEKDATKRYANVTELARALAEVAPEEMRGAAHRIARVAASVAPTMRSSVPPPLAAGKSDGQARSTPQSAPSDGPTRTASAWGETRPREGAARSTRLLPVIAAILGAAALAVLVAFTVQRPAPPRQAPTLAAAPASGTATATASGTATATASGTATATATATVTVTASTSTSTSTTVTASTSTSTSGRVLVVPSARPVPSAKPPSLFDDRE